MQQEGDNCKTLKQCTPCVMAMRQTGKTESLLPTLDRDPWPQPSRDESEPVYPHKMMMTLLYKAQQKDPFLGQLLERYIKVLQEDWSDHPPVSECTPEALALHKALLHIAATSA